MSKGLSFVPFGKYYVKSRMSIPALATVSLLTRRFWGKGSREGDWIRDSDWLESVSVDNQNPKNMINAGRPTSLKTAFLFRL